MGRHGVSESYSETPDVEEVHEVPIIQPPTYKSNIGSFPQPNPLMGMAGLDRPQASSILRPDVMSDIEPDDESDDDDEDSSSGDITQKTVSFREIESDESDEIDEDALEEEEAANRCVRVYDARYKIPRHTNLADLDD